MHSLVKYLTSLPQTTKGSAGGHRIPRGEEGIVIGHMSLCCRLINTSNSEAMSFSAKPVKPEVILSETENGEIITAPVRLAAMMALLLNIRFILWDKPAGFCPAMFFILLI